MVTPCRALAVALLNSGGSAYRSEALQEDGFMQPLQLISVFTCLRHANARRSYSGFRASVAAASSGPLHVLTRHIG
jgi:hypothetical protein